MTSPRLAIKWFARPAEGFAPTELVPLFHRWIQQKRVADHQLIDVADYEHVQDGPGIVLVAYEALFGYDLADGRPGLLYARQRRLDGPFGQKLKTVATASLQAVAAIEEQTGGRLKFATDDVLFRINDRLAAPNTSQTYAQLQPEIQRFFSGLLGEIKLQHQPDERRPFEVSLRAAKPAASLADLLARVK